MTRTNNAKNKKFYKYRVIDIENDKIIYAKTVCEMTEICNLSIQNIRTLINLKDDEYKYNYRNKFRKYEIHKLKTKIKIDN
tara:strand:- start:72 stop:314 length:243 start_codon:yes stop_codon:yes gene_type:complete